MRGGEAKAAAARAWRSDKKLYLALGAVGAFLLALRLVMRSRAASDFIVHKIVQPYHRAVGWLCGFVPFSVAELCWAVLVLFCIWYVGRTVWLLARGRGRRLAVLWRRALGGVLVALSVYTGFTLLWGLTYYAETFEEQAGVTARPVTVDELEATTRLFMEIRMLSSTQIQHIVRRIGAAVPVFVCFRRQPQAHAVFPGAERAEFYRFFLPVHRGGEFECRFARMPAACDHCA